MKKPSFIMLAFLITNAAYGITYDTLNIQMPNASRMGLENSPEVQYEEIKAETKTDEVVAKTIEDVKENISLKDLNVKYLSDEISGEIEGNSSKILSDLSILYNSAIQRSETIRYAIYKLSNPDEDKPNEGTIKKILKPIASFSSIAGTALSDNPYMATGALIGGSLIGAITSDDKKVNYKFTKVDDADMVVLVRKIDELQKKLLFLYMDYISAKELYSMAQDNLNKRKIMYETLQMEGTKEEIIIADSYYRNAQEYLEKAKSKYDLSRTILENLTGKEALEVVEGGKKPSQPKDTELKNDILPDEQPDNSPSDKQADSKVFNSNTGDYNAGAEQKDTVVDSQSDNSETIMQTGEFYVNTDEKPDTKPLEKPVGEIKTNFKSNLKSYEKTTNSLEFEEIQQD